MLFGWGHNQMSLNISPSQIEVEITIEELKINSYVWHDDRFILNRFQGLKSFTQDSVQEFFVKRSKSIHFWPVMFSFSFPS